MVWLHLVRLAFAGAFLANAVPHFASGTMGRPFQTPFADPPGVGLSSSTVNVLWGALNIAVGYLLLALVGDFDPRRSVDVIPFGLGALVIALFCARHFGRINGGGMAGRR